MAQHTDKTIRFGQTGDRLVGVMLVIVIAAAIGYVGTDVLAEVEDSTEIQTSEDKTVTNETFTANYSDTFFYTVSVENSPGDDTDDNVQGDFADDERAFNFSSNTVELTEGTDYEWFPSNGTVKLFNTSATQDPNGDPNGTYAITYNYTTTQSEYGDATTNISEGYTSAISLTDVVFLVLMFGVILTALIGFSQRT